MKYGWIPDVPDFRDFKYTPKFASRILPSEVDLRREGLLEPIYDQGQLGSCTAQSVSKAVWYQQQRQNDPDPVMPSRLFTYYNARRLAGNEKVDSGAMIRDAIKAVAKWGNCPEELWEYDVNKFARKPTNEAYRAATKHQALQYSRIGENLESMKDCLARGFPFVFGFAVYSGIDDPQVVKTGIIKMPTQNESMQGGHAVLCVGFFDQKTVEIKGETVELKNVFIVQNSWGTAWGDGGFCYMPYEYLTTPNLADDRWYIGLMEI